MFAAKNLTLGQANALYKKLGGEDVVRGILDGTMKFVVETVKMVTDLADFFKTRDGLWVSDEFRQHILAPALEMEGTTPALVGEPYDLPEEEMSDEEILEKLGHKVFENRRAFLNTLARLIDAQWGGKGGDLLNNGGNNIFFVRGRNEKGESEVFVIRIYRDVHDGKWVVFTAQFVGNGYFRGVRAFPSN